MNLDDAIRQAREWADGYKALLDGFGEVVDADTDGGYLTVLALLAALDEALPHLVDTRRLAALAAGATDQQVALVVDYADPDDDGEDTVWRVATVNRFHLHLLYDWASSPGEALAAAEREAGQ